MNQDMSIVTLIANASWVVQVVMFVLVLGSIVSWAAIIEKVMLLKRIRALNRIFENRFRSGKSLDDVFSRASENEVDTGPLERVFVSGMSEYQKLYANKVSDTDTLVLMVGRAMRTAARRELDIIETRLSFLATVGSIAPYVGLFGTVWGIMHAFTGLANLEQLSLASVAPGIAEALIATALGLFAAIPAVMAFNRLTQQANEVAIGFEVFAEDFSNILQRSLLTTGGTSADIVVRSNESSRP